MAKKSKQQPARQSEPTRQPAESTSWWGNPIVLGVLFWVVLEGLLATIPGIATWGASHWSVVPSDWRYLILIAAVVLCISAVASSVDRMFCRIPGNRLVLLLMLGICIAAFILLRVHNHAIGDGYFLLSFIDKESVSGFFQQVTTQTSQLGDLLLHWALGKAVVLPLGFNWEAAYVVVAALAGAAGLWALISFARESRGSRTKQLFIVFAGLSAVPVYFWFGHIESYTLSAVAGLWACVLSVSSLRNRRKLKSAWIAFVLATLFHAIAVSLLPMLIYASLKASVRKRVELRFSPPVNFAIGFAIALLGSQVLDLIGFNIFVPLLSNADTTYSAFTYDHLLDSVNVLFRTAPLGVLALLAWPWRRIDRGDEKQRTTQTLLAIGAAGTWYLAFWVDPTLGAPRDWDLLALFGFPMTLWAISLFSSWRGLLARANPVWVPVAVLAIVHVGGLVVANHDAAVGGVALHAILRDDAHHQGGYYEGKRLVQWSDILAKQLDRHDLAIEMLERRARLRPQDPASWVNLGSAYFNNEDFEKAVESFRVVTREDTLNVQAWRRLGRSALMSSDWEIARSAFAKVRELSPEDLEVYYLEGVALVNAGRDSSAIDLFDEVLQSKPDYRDALLGRAGSLGRIGEYDAAIRDLRKAIELDPADNNARKSLCDHLMIAGRYEETIQAARAWLTRESPSPEAHMYLAMALTMKEQFTEALEAWENYDRLRPSEAIALYNIGLLQRKLGSEGKALELLLKCAATFPNFAPPCLDILDIYVSRDDLENAKQWAKEYVRRNPDGQNFPRLQRFLK